MSEIPELLTPRQLSEQTGFSENSLAQDRYHNKGIPYVKIGKRVRYLKDDVIAYLEANRVSNGA